MYWLLSFVFTCALSLNEFPHTFKQASSAVMIETELESNVSFRELKNMLATMSHDLGKEIADVSELQLTLRFRLFAPPTVVSGEPFNSTCECCKDYFLFVLTARFILCTI